MENKNSLISSVDALSNDYASEKKSKKSLTNREFDLAKNDFKAGYNKAKETYKFTEEDILGFLDFYNSVGFGSGQFGRYMAPTMDGREKEHNRNIDKRIVSEYLKIISLR
jgi:hypothetical protein